MTDTTITDDRDGLANRRVDDPLPDTVSECEAEQEAISIAIASIEENVTSRLAEYKAKDTRMPPDEYAWVLRAKYAKRMKGIRAQKLARHAAELRRQERARRHASENVSLLSIVQRHVDDATFSKINAEWRERAPV